jgi:hypothetical protein
MRLRCAKERRAWWWTKDSAWMARELVAFALGVGGDAVALLGCCIVEKMAPSAESVISKALEVPADFRATWRRRVVNRTTRWWHGSSPND